MFITNVNSFILQYMSSIIMSDIVRSSSTILFMSATGQPPPPLLAKKTKNIALRSRAPFYQAEKIQVRINHVNSSLFYLHMSL